MRFSRLRLVHRAAILLLGSAVAASAVSAQQAQRPMTFLDMQQMRSGGSPTPSPDGRWMLYTITVPDWQEAKRQTDIHVVSMQQGVQSSRQLTHTAEKNETSPRWAPDGSFFAFLSNREAPANGTGQNQIFVMRVEGGDARRVTDAEGGVQDFVFSKDGRWMVFKAGRSDEQQLFRLPVTTLWSDEAVEAEKLSTHPTGIGTWALSPDSRRAYFVTPDTIDQDEKKRREEGFTVDIINPETPVASLWALDLDAKRTTRLTRDASYTVAGFTISDDSRWVGYRGTSSDRYKRNITEQSINADVYLLEVATGQIERLTSNEEVPESGPYFSPDGRSVAFGAPDDITRYSMKNDRMYVRALSARGQPFRKIGTAFDGDVGLDWWSEDGRTIYFNTGIKATSQLLALDVESGAVKQLTNEQASVNVSRDDDTGTLLVSYSDEVTPGSTYTVGSLDAVANKASWTRLTNPNPQTASFALGDQEEVTWRSSDGRMVGGVLVKPVGYQPGQRYPLIVAIHGGPASADVLGFNGGYGSQVYAGAGYVVLRPNYRGSTNYGEAHKTDIVGDYFPQAFDDIMTGVDHLIREGIVDQTRMGALGWSAGGHWSNWILTHTDRFKAISSGAGTSNWISMYAQSDVQRNRQFYLGDDLPYDNFDAYWDQSPIQYIRNAKTPTMIHVVKGDPRVPSPQSVELHQALKRIGVPTELFMYPGESHGIPDARNQLVKAVAEMAWMDHYVRGMSEKFNWQAVLRTLEKQQPPAPRPATQEQQQGGAPRP